MRIKRDLEINAINDTLQRCKTEYFNETKELIDNNTLIYTEAIPEVFTQLSYDKKDMNIEVINSGTVSAGKDILKKTGKRTAILNFADAIRPGGWVLDGAPTQEENICRCSNLYPALIAEEPFKKYYYVNANFMYPRIDNLYGKDIEVPKDVTWEKLNPLHAVYTNRLMYLKDVTFFKNDTTYELEDAYKLDVITCPAPAVDWDIDEVNYAYEVLYSRTEQIIKSAILNKADNIVLGAWGCGAFGQNPFMISKVFKDVLRQYPAFDNVIFAIRCTAEYWKDNNYQVFVKTFEEEEE